MSAQGKVPICGACTRLRSFDKDHPTWWCEAFPDGIPEDIGSGNFDHRKAHAGDRGIRFELDPAQADRLDLFEKQ